MDTPIVQQPTLFGESQPVAYKPYRGHRYHLPPGKSYCSSCKSMKDVSAFPFSKFTPNGVGYWCKQCAKSNREHYKAVVTESCWRKRYGITAIEYQALFDAQGGVCAICKKHENRIHKGTKANMCVDHDHATGKVRGLLCAKCNSGLGYFADNIDTLLSAVNYLQRLQSADCNTDSGNESETNDTEDLQLALIQME